MQLSLKSLAAVGVLTLASAAAFGQTAPPAGPVPNADTGNGGLFFAAWDGERSVVQWLGPTYTTSDVGDLTTGSIHDLYSITNFTTFFPNQDNVQWAVFSADNARAGFQGAGLSTTVANPQDLDPNIVPFFFVEVSNNAQRISDFGNQAMNGALGCNGANPCFANSNAAITYAGEGGTLQGANPGGTSWTIAAGVGDALEFYNFVTTTGSDGVEYQQYARNGQVGHWLLNANGTLQYDFGAPVPLPAALWLLLSGLTGLGVISRKRSA
jgi:hypothetical protein